MIRTVFSCAFIWAIASSAGFAQTDLDGSYPGNASLDFTAAHALVSADFLDPSSAQYKGMSLQTRSDGESFVCGWVNARNGFGGYTPFYPFYIDLQRSSAEVAQKYDDELTGPMVMIVLESVGCSSSLGL